MNPKILALQKALKAAVAKMEAALAKAVEEGRSPTAEEHETFTAAKTEVTDLKSLIAQAELIAKELAELAQIADTPAAELDLTAATTPRARGIETRDNTEDEPWGSTPEASFGAFLREVRQAEKVGIQNISPRLRKTMSAAPSGANESVGSEGMFAVNPELSAFITKRIFEVGVLPGRCYQLPLPAGISKVSLKLNGETSRVTGSRWGGVQVYWRAEAATVTAKKPSIREVDAKLESLMGVFYNTEEGESDSVMGRVALEAFPDEIAAQLDADIFKGEGSGKASGFSNSSARVTQDKETGQAAATIVAENVINMFSRMPAAARMNAAWFVGCDAEPQLAQMTLPGGGLTPYPIYMPPGGLSQSPYGTLFGRPVIPFEHCSKLGTEGDIVFADPSWYLLLTSQQQAGAESSIHVRFLYNENTYRWVYRVNGLPMLASPFTAANGTTTLSPFVTLITRS